MTIDDTPRVAKGPFMETLKKVLDKFRERLLSISP
jgi:hypothetical protein